MDSMLHAHLDAPEILHTASELPGSSNCEIGVSISLAIDNLHGMRQVTHLYCSLRYSTSLRLFMGRQIRVIPIIPQPHTSDQSIN